MKRIAWGITGGGQYLAESIAAVGSLAARSTICTFVSLAGEEVLHMYGLFPQVRKISGGGYLEEIFLECDSGKSFPKTGRLMLGRFNMLIVAPATSNTVAKIAHGIADTLVTNAVSLANKASVPVYILPTDLEPSADTRTPYSVDRERCQSCDPCPAAEGCPAGAIAPVPQIDLALCDGCGKCVSLCLHGAIGPVEFRVRTREIDRINIERLRIMPGIEVLESAEDIRSLD